jgi:hypothetical protein
MFEKLKAWMLERYLPRVLGMGKSGGTATNWIGLTITIILGICLIPIIVDQVQNTNTTNWTFTGSTGAKTLFLLLPFIFIIGLVVYFIAALLGKI